MNRTEIIFSDLPSIATSAKNITQDFSGSNLWRKIPYSTDFASGNMLFTCESDYPEDVTIPLGLSGKWLVYVSTLGFSNNKSYFHIKLSSHPCWTEVQYSAYGQPRSWHLEEYAKETLVFQGDLTGEDVIISRPHNSVPGIVSILWLRCVPLPENEPLLDFTDTANKSMQLHFDSDLTNLNIFDQASYYCTNLFAAKDSDAGLISQEIMAEYAEPHHFETDDAYPIDFFKIRNLHNKHYHAIHEDVEQARLKMAHQSNYRLYATFRLCQSELLLPFTHLDTNDFAVQHPEYNMIWRDGSEVSMLSYAYDQVQERMINRITHFIKKGYDGATLLLHRGLLIGFEQPVRDLFAKMYPEAGDICTLPLNDYRVRNCRCYFMTEFVTKLHNKLSEIAKEQGRKIGINVISDYSLDTAMDIGLDIREWAKRGLITEATQGDMEAYEDLDCCMSDTHSNQIDLEKYRQQNAQRQVLCRNYGTNIPKVLAGLPQYLELEELYGVEVYAVLPWLQSMDGPALAENAKQLYEAGAKRLVRFNSLQCIPFTDEWNVVKRLGHKTDLSRLQNDALGLRNFYRVLSINNVNISIASPNWRG